MDIIILKIYNYGIFSKDEKIFVELRGMGKLGQFLINGNFLISNINNLIEKLNLFIYKVFVLKSVIENLLFFQVFVLLNVIYNFFVFNYVIIIV